MKTLRQLTAFAFGFRICSLQIRITVRFVTSLRHAASLALTGLAITMNTHACFRKNSLRFSSSDQLACLADRQRRRDGRRVHQPFPDSHQRRRGLQRRGVAGKQWRVCFRAVVARPPGPDGLWCFVIRLRGDGRRYKFTARTETGFDTPLYQCAFVTKRGEWEEHRLAFKDFVPTFRGRILTGVPPLNPAKVTSVGFLIADKQDGAFRLEISWVKALTATP